MKRRDFLQHSGTATALSAFTIKGFSMTPNPKLPFLQALEFNGVPEDRVLVLVQLAGGNDGLHTLVPLDQYGNMKKARKNIILPEQKLLRLNKYDKLALHPNMTQFQQMFNEGLVSTVQDVGYPEQDYSHFRSMDIWMSASDSKDYVENGWAARYIEDRYPGFPKDYPNDKNPDPLAIQIGSTISMALMGHELPAGMAITDPKAYYEFVNDVVEEAPDTPFGRELEFLRYTSQQAQVYYESVKKAAEKGKNLSKLYPVEGKNYLADELRIVAQLIKGGLKTPVYIVTLDGFDTHSEQINTNGNPLEGDHADLLRNLSEAIAAFQDDLRLLGIDDRVVGMTFSEFGRTIASNGSFGTDHGAAAPLFVFGKSVLSGVIGKNPVIPTGSELDKSGDVPMQYDFRSVYATVLQDWFGLATPEKILGRKFDILPIFKSKTTSLNDWQPREKVEVSIFPNPCQYHTSFKFSIQGGRVRIRVFDLGGRLLQTVTDAQFPAGTHLVPFQRHGLPQGHYHVQISVNETSLSRKLVVVG
jgi:uncharacterized protein (DUF1501 family)